MSDIEVLQARVDELVERINLLTKEQGELIRKFIELRKALEGRGK